MHINPRHPSYIISITNSAPLHWSLVEAVNLLNPTLINPKSYLNEFIFDTLFSKPPLLLNMHFAKFGFLWHVILFSSKSKSITQLTRRRRSRLIWVSRVIKVLKPNNRFWIYLREIVKCESFKAKTIPVTIS